MKFPAIKPLTVQSKNLSMLASARAKRIIRNDDVSHSTKPKIILSPIPVSTNDLASSPKIGSPKKYIPNVNAVAHTPRRAIVAFAYLVNDLFRFGKEKGDTRSFCNDIVRTNKAKTNAKYKKHTKNNNKQIQKIIPKFKTCVHINYSTIKRIKKNIA